MQLTIVYAFIGGTIVAGLGIGIYLQSKLPNTNQNIQLPSAFGYKEQKELPRRGLPA